MKFSPKKLFGFLLVLAVLALPSVSFADVETADDGVNFGPTTRIDFGSGLVVSGTAGTKTVSAATAAITGGTATGFQRGTTYVEPATDTLTAAQLKQGIILNTGASGAVVYTLPAPTAGDEFTVYLTASQDVNINPADGTTILTLTNAAGDAISSAATAGNQITLYAVSATEWIPRAASGTWSDVN